MLAQVSQMSIIGYDKVDGRLHPVRALTARIFRCSLPPEPFRCSLEALSPLVVSGPMACRTRKHGQLADAGSVQGGRRLADAAGHWCAASDPHRGWRRAAAVCAWCLLGAPCRAVSSDAYRTPPPLVFYFEPHWALTTWKRPYRPPRPSPLHTQTSMPGSKSFDLPSATLLSGVVVAASRAV